MRELFAADADRARMHVEAAGWYFDYAKHRADAETLRLLLELVEARGLRARIDAMFRGDHINVTEDRSVLHVALRMPPGTALVVDGVDLGAEVQGVLQQMSAFADSIRDGSRRGHTGRPIRNVVNIGIGGSDLGPAMAYDALRAYSRADMQFRFVSNVDGADLVDALRGLDAAETLFIISSKTFTTLETLTQRAGGPRVGCSTRWATTTRPSPSTSSRCRRTRRRSRSSASTPRTCSRSGTGSAAGIRCGRRSVCR